MTALELAQTGLVGEISRLVAAINEASAEEAKGAYDRIGVAREWAKLQEDAAILAERLVWLEAVILRRIGQLEATAVLPGPRRAAARHFATLGDADLSSLLEAFPARSAISAYNLWAKAEGIRASRRRGSEFALGEHRTKVDDDEDIKESLRYAVDTRVVTVRQAAAVIVNEYATFMPTTVGRIVDEFIDEELPINEYASPLEVTAFRKGLSEAVREAFLSAPVEATERSWEIPAFITTFHDETAEWLRVPSEFATVGDALQTLALRRGQIESAQRSYEALAEVLERRFSVNSRELGDWLRNDQTALARRLAKSGSVA